MLDDVALASRLAVPVLLTSADRHERERCARLIHAMSGRGRGPFVVCTAGTSDPALLRSRFDKARGGTLFVDELGALTPGEQTELYALLDGNGRAAGHGGSEPDVRVITAASPHTTRNGNRPVCDRLFYRLNVLHIVLADASG